MPDRQLAVKALKERGSGRPRTPSSGIMLPQQLQHDLWQNVGLGKHGSASLL